MMNDYETYDETNDETCDVITLNTASKCLARMTGYWDPEFEPSIEEIVIKLSMIIYGDSLSSLPLASSHSGRFPYSV